MELLNRLTIKNLKLNKKRTIVTIIGIILATALITGVTSLISSFRTSLIEYDKKTDGDYHYCFKNVPVDEVTYITNHRNIEKSFLTQNIGYSILEESQNEQKPYMFIISADENALKNMGLDLIKGRLPENENEIVISEHIITNAQVKYDINDELDLEIGKRILDGVELNQNNAYINNMDVKTKTEKIERFIPEDNKKYKIVGIISRPSFSLEEYIAPGYTVITKLEKLQENKNVNVYTRYENLNKADKTTQSILNLTDKEFEEYKKGIGALSEDKKSSTKYEVATNSDLIRWEAFKFGESTTRAFFTIGAIVISIIIITSIFCIRNSFAISITEKVKQYGMLASIGATSKQIKKNVLYEALILGIIGIPLGILSGAIAIFILLKIVTKILSSEVLTIELIFSINIIGILLSIVLSSITIYLSARASAKRASKISPIEAIRSNQDIFVKSKKLKTPFIIKTLFGIGGVLAYKNLKRNKRKYRTTVISITVSVAIFISMISFMNYAFKVSSVYYTNYQYNFIIASNDIENTYDKIKEISKNNLVDSYSIIRSLLFNIKAEELESHYTEEAKKYNYFSELDEKGNKMIKAIALGDKEYKRYVKELGLKYEECKNKAIIIDDATIYKNIDGKGSYIMYRIYDYKSGDKINVELMDKNKLELENVSSQNNTKLELEIATTTDKRPKGLEASSSDNGYIILSDELLEKYSDNIENNVTLCIQAKDASKLEEQINRVYPNTFDIVGNLEKMAQEQKSIWIVIAIFLYGFITVISLIGITNIFNTITTNMELRQKEFANLKSIGMTKKEFNRMIRLESILYCIKSLIFGIGIGLGLSVLIYRAFGINTQMSYMLPVNGILISTIAVVILIGTIMKYSLNKINRQNIIETIRKDNI